MSLDLQPGQVLLEDDFLTAARTLREIERRRSQFALDTGAEERDAKEIIAKVLAEGETGVDPDTGEELVTIRPGAKVWNEAAAKANLPADLLASITSVTTREITTVDKDRAKQTFAPAIYDLCTKQNKASLVVL